MCQEITLNQSIIIDMMQNLLLMHQHETHFAFISPKLWRQI